MGGVGRLCAMRASFLRKAGDGGSTRKEPQKRLLSGEGGRKGVGWQGGRPSLEEGDVSSLGGGWGNLGARGWTVSSVKSTPGSPPSETGLHSLSPRAPEAMLASRAAADEFSGVLSMEMFLGWTTGLSQTFSSFIEGDRRRGVRQVYVGRKQAGWMKAVVRCVG